MKKKTNWFNRFIAWLFPKKEVVVEENDVVVEPEEDRGAVTLNPNGWHRKLIKWVFSTAPDPTTMENFCPYFWILGLALLFVPFTTPFKLIYLFFKDIAKSADVAFTNLVNAKADKWMKRCSTEELYLIASGQYNLPWFVTSKRFKDYTYFTGWYSGLEQAFSLATLTKKVDDNKKDWEWLKEVEETEAVKAYRANKEKRQKEQFEKERIAREKRAKTAKKIKALFSPIGIFFNFLIELCSIDWSNYSKLVKLSKRVIGTLISILVGTIFYYVVTIVIALVMIVINAWTMQWTFYGITGLIILTLAVLIGIFIWNFGGAIIEWIIDRLKPSPFTIKVFKGIGNALYYFPYLPLYHLIYSFIYQIIIMQFFVSIAKGLWYGFIKFTGIFGQYFGSAYSDFCPRIKWKK